MMQFTAAVIAAVPVSVADSASVTDICAAVVVASVSVAYTAAVNATAIACCY